MFRLRLMKFRLSTIVIVAAILCVTLSKQRSPDGQAHVSNTATIWRWRQAFQHDFAARMDWCVKEKAEANHNPHVVVEGDTTKAILHRNVKPGEKVVLSAARTTDPDGDELSYRWLHYGEAGRDLPNVRDIFSVPLKGAESQQTRLTVPGKLPRNTKDIHVILDVEDNGTPSLHAYRRVILHVAD